jgi:2-amino-4-hydroxy-6-hydroxymethyldihydropteridine diphosphokinase
MEISNTVYFSLGSNLGNRLCNLENALAAIKKSIGNIISCSSVYSTEAVGFDTDADFLNICVNCDTKQNPEEVLTNIGIIENELGRVRNKLERYSSRTIDIDIIFFSDCIIQRNNLQIPHSEYQNRLFVLLPLIEIGPELKDPRNNQLISDYLSFQNLKQSIHKENFVLSY